MAIPEGHEHGVLSMILASAFSSLVYGAFAVTYCIGCWILWGLHHPSERRSANIAMSVASTLMFVVATLHLSFSLNLVHDVLSASEDELALEAKLRTFDYTNLDQYINVVRFYAYVTQTILADIFLIYRVWIVWGRQRRVAVFLAIILLCNAAIGYSAFVHPHYLVPSFYGLTLCTNLLSTGLIIRRVILSQRQGSRLKLWTIIGAIIESAAIYSLASVALVVTFFLSPTIGYPVCVNLCAVLIGLVFSFIVIRMGYSSANSAVQKSQSWRTDLHSIYTNRTTSVSGPSLVDELYCSRRRSLVESGDES